MRVSVKTMVFLALIPPLAGPGCHSPRITERRTLAPAAVGAGSGCVPTLSIKPASAAEITYLRLRDEAEGPDGAEPTRLLALADLADQVGCESLGRDPAAALPWFRDSAVYAIFGLMAAGTAEVESDVIERAVFRHNHAVTNLVRCAGTDPRGPNPLWREQLAAVGVEIASPTSERAAIPCDELWIASDFRVRNLEHVGRGGLGVPLIELSKFPIRDAVPDRFYPERLRLPATAVLSPTGPLQNGAWRSRPAVLALHDPARETTVALGPASGNLALAADLTTPLAHQFIKSPLNQLAWGGMFRPEAYDAMLGIFMKEPYAAGKIPVLFIHGLWSSPDVWLMMTNSLQKDPVIRARYQFWYAYYPTGAPLMVSAGRIRQSLRELREAIDPSRGDQALDRMVVVGHSLGGVLSKQLIQSSGRSVERALFTRPLEEMAMSPESRSLLSRYLYFEPEPSIGRAIFIAAPHRGSNTASQWIGRLGSALIRRPGALASLHEEIISWNGAEAVQPAYRAGPPSSIDNLTWESPILKTLAGLPIAPGVPYHSIVANLVPVSSSDLWTDGVVSYESAHIEGALSEIVVRHNHFVNDTVEATAEVHRLLTLHISHDLTTMSSR